MSDLLHNLLRQQAALQLSFSQPLWDILIPVYFGDLNKDFDADRTSAILIQVRNGTTPSKFSLRTDLPHYAEFSHTDDPILYILMDLGTTKNEVDVSAVPKAASGSRKNLVGLKQHIFGIHALGADTHTYGCPWDSELRDASQRLLSQVMQTSGRGVRRDHDELCQRNKRFNYHSWESQFPVIQTFEGDAAELDQEDTPMAGTE